VRFKGRARVIAIAIALGIAIALIILPAGLWMHFMPPAHFDLGNGLRLSRIRDLHDAQRLTEFGDLAWSPDGQLLAAYSEYSHLVTVWNAAGEKVSEIRRGGVQVIGGGGTLGFLPDSQTLITVATFESEEDSQYGLNLWNAKTGVLERKIVTQSPGLRAPASWPNKFAVSRDGQWVVTLRQQPPFLAAIYSTKTWQIERRIEEATSQAGVAVTFSPDSRWLAIGKIKGIVTLYDFADIDLLPARTLEAYPPASPMHMVGLAFSPDGKLLATGGIFATKLAPGVEHDTVKIWNIADFSLVASFACDPFAAHELTWSSDGRYLAATMERRLGIFSLSNPQHQAIVDLGGELVNAVGFSPDGKLLAVAVGTTVSIFSISRQ
jgi:WD40 repeat protein